MSVPYRIQRYLTYHIIAHIISITINERLSFKTDLSRPFIIAVVIQFIGLENSAKCSISNNGLSSYFWVFLAILFPEKITWKNKLSRKIKLVAVVVESKLQQEGSLAEFANNRWWTTATLGAYLRRNSSGLFLKLLLLLTVKISSNMAFHAWVIRLLKKLNLRSQFLISSIDARFNRYDWSIVSVFILKQIHHGIMLSYSYIHWID